jgi:hypothetical protein
MYAGHPDWDFARSFWRGPGIMVSQNPAFTPAPLSHGCCAAFPDWWMAMVVINVIVAMRQGILPIFIVFSKERKAARGAVRPRRLPYCRKKGSVPPSGEPAI